MDESQQPERDRRYPLAWSFVFLFLWLETAQAQYGTVTGNVTGELTQNVDARIIVLKPYNAKAKVGEPEEDVMLSVQPNGTFKIEHIKPGEYCFVFCRRKIVANDRLACDGDPSYRPVVVPKVQVEDGKLTPLDNVLLEKASHEHIFQLGGDQCTNPHNCMINLTHRKSRCEVRTIIPDKQGYFAFPDVKHYLFVPDHDESDDYDLVAAPISGKKEGLSLSNIPAIPEKPSSASIASASLQVRESKK